VSMLTVDDELYQQATEAAAAQGKTVDEFVDEALRKALSMVGVRCTVRNGLPVMVVSDNPPHRSLQSAPVPGGGRFFIAQPDIDVLLALTGSNHAHHQAAHRWFNREASAGWATCVDLDGLLYLRYTRFQWLPSRR
jgi:post-segregation antitoxin (ccd killing protein)